MEVYFKKDDDMKNLVDSFPLDGDKNELLNKTSEPIVKIKVYDYKGKQKTIKPRCELCAFCEVVEDEQDDDIWTLLCLKKSQVVDYNHKCDDFNITRALLHDIYCGCLL